MDDLVQMLSMTLTLFLLMDSIGNVPIFIALLKNIPRVRQKKIIFRELCIALFVILLFWLVGDPLLHVLKIGLPTILISGGIILFLIALKMIFPAPKDTNEIRQEKEPFIVPLAIPLVAGPAVLAAVILYSGRKEKMWICGSAIVLSWIATTIILVSSSFLKEVLGKKGLTACERLMGLILTLLAVQMFLEGISQYMGR
jgi:multiple antibiotic resistance protein